MESILRIEIKDQQVLPLLQQLETLHLIRLLDGPAAPSTQKASDKYKGVFTKKDAQSFDAHTTQMRGEWNNT